MFKRFFGKNQQFIGASKFHFFLATPLVLRGKICFRGLTDVFGTNQQFIGASKIHYLF